MPVHLTLKTVSLEPSNAVVLGQEIGSIPVHDLSLGFFLRVDVELVKDVSEDEDVDVDEVIIHFALFCRLFGLCADARAANLESCRTTSAPSITRFLNGRPCHARCIVPTSRRNMPRDYSGT